MKSWKEICITVSHPCCSVFHPWLAILFLFPLVLLRSREKYTVPVGLTTFFGEYATDWSSLFAGLVIATVPLIILFLVATKQIVAGLTAGMSK